MNNEQDVYKEFLNTYCKVYVDDQIDERTGKPFVYKGTLVSYSEKELLFQGRDGLKTIIPRGKYEVKQA